MESIPAFELICIVDQIHDYAVNHHRPFVMNHLEAWHARHQKTLEPLKKAARKIYAATEVMDHVHDDSDTIGFGFDDDSEIDDFDFGLDVSDINSCNIDELAELLCIGPRKPAEWLRLKEQSKNARQEIANETRKRNRSVLDIAQASKSAKRTTKDTNTRPTS